MLLPIDVSKPGFVPDVVDVVLPEGAWTEGQNCQFRDGALEKVKGSVDVFGSASATPVWVEPVSDGLTTFWTYGNESRLYATDGSLHADVSSITYTCNPLLGYTGGAFHGYMVANDAVNAPQTWVPSLANKFQPLANWPGSTTCEVIRPFGDFLVALRITESATYNARLIRWSDRAAVGSLPGSWDYTDPTNQSGRTELGQTHDALVDCLPLRDSNVVYKQFHTWIMQYVGGDDVFAFREVFKESGLLTENCARAFGPRHFAVTDNDIVVHDGNDGQSIIDGRLRRWLFNRLSQDRFQTAFVAPDYKERQMWFCFPEEGRDFPSLALPWSWRDDQWGTPRELGEYVAHASTGLVDASGVTFDADPGTFDGGPAGEFDEYPFTPWSQRLLLAAASRKQLMQGNTGEVLGAASSMTVRALRTHMLLDANDETVKRITRLYLRIRGTAGETVRIRIGRAWARDDAVHWHGPYTYTIGTDYKVDCHVTGRFFHLYLEKVGASNFRLGGLQVEFDVLGLR